VSSELGGEMKVKRGYSALESGQCTPIWSLPVNTMTLVVRAPLPHTASFIRRFRELDG
jgi:hypothetical protein